MKYISTRGRCPAQNFEEVLLTGLAPDGGLYVPEQLPAVSTAQLRDWAGLSYIDLAFEVIKPFVANAIPEQELRQILRASYSGFAHPDIAPLRELGEDEWLLELYHGPTLAFKDFALQVLGRLLDTVLSRRQQRVVILGATSGDTGSAALEGCRHSRYVDIFILHPHERVSEVQRRQMTTVHGENVFNLAVQGNFDDCQRLVKAAFADQSFLPDGRQLVAVNSINWARILLQIVYYFWAALRLGAPDRMASFSVPTGNFGDIYAGYLAKCMGLPIDQLVVATNKNDILHRFISRNEYVVSELSKTFSPSMDILVSSNFERYLFDLFGRDASLLRDFMNRFGKESLSVSAQQWQQVKDDFVSASVDDETTCQTIAEVFAEHGLLLDPHTAVGLRAARECRNEADASMIVLATAHPAKFDEAIKAAGLEAPQLPAHLADLFEREERFEVVANDLAAVVDIIAKHLV